MDYKTGKQVRFYTGENGKSNFDHSWQIPDKQIPEHKISAPLLMNGRPITGTNHHHMGLKLGKYPDENNNDSKGKRVLDPGSEIILQWNKIFLFSCLVALFVDPLFFYLPSVDNEGRSSCMLSDVNLGIVVTCLRSIADIFYMLNIAIKFRTAYVSPSSRVLGRGELVMDPEKIARKYLKSNFFIDLVATLPLPQIVIWFIIPAIRTPNADHTTNALVLIVLLQYIPRLYLIFPLSSQIIKTTGVVTKTAWAGAAYNLVLYMLASHILGSSWYLLSFERHATCWKSTCRNDDKNCALRYLDCGFINEDKRKEWANGTNLFDICDPTNETTFHYGIFGDAVGKGVVYSNFIEKYLYCLWWGLQNLSSYGQNLETSTFIGETSFAILIAIMGLVLFAHLIGNMQTYLQSITVRLEEWRLRRRDTESWMRHRQLPNDLQERVRKFVQYKWLATRGVDEESILRNLPSDLRRDIQRHLCLDLVRRVPFFSQMDDQLLDAICERLVSSLSTQHTYIVREGDPVSEMLFIIRGRLDSSTTNGGRTGFFNSITLRPGDFCGEELLAWALLPKSTLNLPSSTRTVRALSEVEAFALRAEDLKFVANQFRRLHSKKLQHTFRFYSYHWRTWAACFIQAAWRRMKKRRMQWNLSMSESSYRPDDDDDGRHHENEHHEEALSNANMQNLNVTILASRFAANTRRGILKTKDVDLIKLQKPEEPDFSADPDDE
ncbi:probable cyclic nucleotide-gated ion channel 14 isoform X1 [Rutidosis leptorrhynchoides]